MPTPPTSNVPVDLSKCWTMSYRHGVNAVLSKNFFFDGDMKAAIGRAQKHCSVMGYKYHFIRPMICNIELEEGVQLGTIDPRTQKPYPPAVTV